MQTVEVRDIRRIARTYDITTEGMYPAPASVGQEVKNSLEDKGHGQGGTHGARGGSGVARGHMSTPIQI
ncbi:hypothetical protein [Paracidovorax cattleyae]|uniref:hypothetical protein n=1 Tax=Paracidovorax cattleyae TaxID=80868 RepID=UPI00115F9183|nr:hypothetical protein [Paracidovorax cattleyae]MBF9264099.1 hypothetical protein [Paracidovorax cattleyae]